mgnify:FL=1
MLARLILICSLLVATPAMADWQEGMWIGVQTLSPKPDRVIGIWCYAGVGCVDKNNKPSTLTFWTWHAVDISNDVPASTIGVFLNGMLLASNPTGTICSIEVWFRAPGVTLPTCNQTGFKEPCLRVIWQMVDMINGGQRTNGFALVPVVGGKFEFLWTTGGPGWGTGCSPGLNVGIDGYVRQ